MTEEVAVRHIDDLASFKKTVKGLPQYTLRPKLPSAQDIQARLPTEPAARGDLRAEVEAVKPLAPKWTMGAREAGIPPPVKQPGPGQYALRSTIQQTHPSEVLSGRGWTWGSTNRSKIGTDGSKTPGPTDYKSNSEPSLKKAASYTMRAKPEASSKIEVSPGCQKYKVDKLNHHGPLTAPCWTLGPRRSLLSQARGKEPGPGSFTPHVEANGRHTRSAKWSFGSEPRFKTSRHQREPPY